MQSIKILSWNVNGLKKNWDTLLQLMTVELPELVCIQNYRAHKYDHPYTIDLGLPKDENIPDGELWVCNYSRIYANPRTSNGVAIFTRWAFAQSYSTYGKFDANNRPVPDTGWVWHLSYNDFHLPFAESRPCVWFATGSVSESNEALAQAEENDKSGFAVTSWVNQRRSIDESQ